MLQCDIPLHRPEAPGRSPLGASSQYPQVKETQEEYF